MLCLTIAHVWRYYMHIDIYTHICYVMFTNLPRKADNQVEDVEEDYVVCKCMHM